MFTVSCFDLDNNVQEKGGRVWNKIRDKIFFIELAKAFRPTSTGARQLKNGVTEERTPKSHQSSLIRHTCTSPVADPVGGGTGARAPRQIGRGTV